MRSSARRPIVDLTDEQARRALRLKWGSVPRDVIPAWVAEMDYAVDPVVMEAVQQALADGVTGYPLEHEPALGEAYAGWSGRHFGWAPSPEAGGPAGTGSTRRPPPGAPHRPVHT